jgi:hypothetical protein
MQREDGRNGGTGAGEAAGADPGEACHGGGRGQGTAMAFRAGLAICENKVPIPCNVRMGAARGTATVGMAGTALGQVLVECAPARKQSHATACHRATTRW